MQPAFHSIPFTIQRQCRLGLLAAASALLFAGCGSMPSTPDTQAAPQARAAIPAATPVPALPPAGSGRGGYYQDDGPGDRVPENLHALPDAEPKVEPYGKRGNRPYVVFGKTYTPFLHDRPFKQRGRGSWYGKKFHGQKTSSGEAYDMYKMTAAHPTMPLPSYARVTNVANGRQVIVRVNDRGPFLAGRIIDLSYTAALKLDYLKQGSAELIVERLLPDDIARINAERQATATTPVDVQQAAAPAPVSHQLTAAAQSEPQTAKPTVTVLAVPSTAVVSEAQAASTPAVSGFYLQLGAYAQANSAEAARSRLQQQWAGTLPPIEVIPGGAVLRLFAGPFATRAEAAAAAQKILEAGGAKPLVVQR